VWKVSRKVAAPLHASHRRNVSLYNQNLLAQSTQRRTVGMVGLSTDEKHVTSSHFKLKTGDVILLSASLTDPQRALRGWGHAFLKVLHGRKEGACRRCDFGREDAVHERSAHDQIASRAKRA
jgi:phosphoribosylformylglycinamidine (FGAM) synthase-like enzyme